MRYLLYGYYGHGNFGDDLLLRALIEGIAKRDRDASFLVYSFDPTPPFDDRWRVRFVPLARSLENIRRRPWRLLSYLRRFGAAIRSTDTFVIGGGALFLDKGRFNLSLALLYLTVLFARLLRRPVVLVGVAVDHLDLSIDRWLTRRIFAAAGFVAVREAPSLGFAPPGAPARLAADLALGLEWRELPATPSRSKPVIGLCFIDYYRTVEHSPERHQAYEAAIRRLVEHHRDRYDFAVVVLQRGRGQRDDWIESALDAGAPIASITVHDMESADALARSVDFMITTRFHLGLLGTIWGKPVLVIDHEAKMAWLASALALPSISMADFIASDQIDLDRLFAGYDRAHTAALLQAERGRAAANFEWLAR